MSHPTPHGSHESFEVEEDHVPMGKIIGIAVVSLIVFGLGIVWSTLIQQNEAGTLIESGNQARPAHVYKPEIGIVDQVLFEKQQVAAKLREAHLQRLSSYGWVDRKGGVIHLPIDRAMDELAGGRP